MTAPAREGLLPCPFCGAADGRLVQAFVRATDEFAFWSVECLDCGAEIADDESQEAADRHWNRRATPPEPSSEVVGERLALEAIKAVTATCKDAAAGLSRIMAIARSAGVEAPYTDLMKDSRVRLIVERPRSEWRHLLEGACAIPPAGWTCSRAPGHDGPCAASPAPAADAEVRDGWKLVPVEPTEAMTLAGGSAALDHATGEAEAFVANVWSAMLAASPKAPSVAIGAGDVIGYQLLMFNGNWTRTLYDQADAEQAVAQTDNYIREMRPVFLAPASASIPADVERDRFANDEAAKALYNTWDDQPGWVPWVERGNSLMQERARREVML